MRVSISSREGSGMAKQLECRITITHALDGKTFEMGMLDPVSGRHEPLGRHPTSDIERIVGGLRTRIEREGHLLTFSEVTGPR